MATGKRPATQGNRNVDYTKIREGLKNLPVAIQATLRNAVPKNGRNATQEDLDQTNKFISPVKLERVSNIVSNNINAAADLRAITPYIDKAELIWKTILLSPNGKQDQILNHDTQTTKFKNTLMHNQLLTVWDGYYNNDYKIEAELNSWVGDLLFNTGSVVLFNLSRPGLDYLINGSELLTDARTGNEALKETFAQKSKAYLESEFIKENDRYIARNKGIFVRDPSTDKSRVSGLESLLGNKAAYEGKEFDIFEQGDDKDFGGSFKLTLTDNPAILYLSKFEDQARQNEIDSIVGAESFDGLVNSLVGKKGKSPKKDDKSATTQNMTESQMAATINEIYPQRNTNYQSIQYVKPNDALSVAPYGKGLVWQIPSEAVIPIHLNGNIRKKTDFIVLLDDEGNFLKTSTDAEYYSGSKSQGGNYARQEQNGNQNHLISNLRKIQEGKECDFDMSEFAEMAKNTIIKRFISSVVSGNGQGVSITIDEETNKIFLARMFKGQGVRCLYVPGEAITYMAVKYNRLGIGQSLTQAAKMHIARLAAFDLADALANLEASQPHSMLTINLEKENADPTNFIAMARSAFFQSNPRLHSLLSSAQLSVPEIVDSLRESSLTVKVNAGDNAHAIGGDITLDPMEKQHFKTVDDDSRQAVLNSIANYFNLPRGWLDVSDDQNNFQIEAITEHEMVFNQGLIWQEEISAHIADFERKHCRVSADLMTRLINVIMENKKNWTPDSKEQLPGTTDEEKVKIILADFISGVYCYLPTPTSIEKTNKLTDNLEAIDKLVGMWEQLSGSNILLEKMTKVLGIDAEQFSSEEIKSMVRAVFLTEAFKRYNMPMPFDEIVSDGKGGGIASLVSSVVTQRKNIAEFIAKFTMDVSDADKKAIQSYGDRIAKKIESLNEVRGEGGDDLTNNDDDNLDANNDDLNNNDDLSQDDNSDLTNNDQQAEEDNTTPPAEESESEEEEDKQNEEGGDEFNPFTGPT